MKQIEKRVQHLENRQPQNRNDKTMADLYSDPEILKDFHALYPTEQESKKMTADYHRELRERGLL